MDAVGVAGEAGLEIGVERQIRRFGEVAEVAQRIGAVDGAIALACGEGHAGAGAGERREAERGEIFGRADVERIGNDKTARSRMQLGEAGALFCDRRHHSFPFGIKAESAIFCRPSESKLSGASQRS